MPINPQVQLDRLEAARSNILEVLGYLSPEEAHEELEGELEEFSRRPRHSQPDALAGLHLLLEAVCDILIGVERRVGDIEEELRASS